MTEEQEDVPGFIAKIQSGSVPGEAIHHPSHYNAGRLEVIDVIEDWQLGFHAGNVVKYVARHQHKGTPVQDLEKARWYLTRLINKLKANER